jgi:hypothetical protein
MAARAMTPEGSTASSSTKGRAWSLFAAAIESRCDERSSPMASRNHAHLVPDVEDVARAKLDAAAVTRSQRGPSKTAPTQPEVAGDEPAD